MDSIYQICARWAAYKPSGHQAIYDRLFGPIRLMPLAILELGVYNGGSIKTWEEYFPCARVAGIDRKLPALDVSQRVRLYEGDQADVNLLAQVAAEVAPNGFDIIIDDCAHIGALAKTSFWCLFDNHLRPGGLYCIEDWTTGFWPTWPDGHEYVAEPDTERHMPSHDGGMIGFIKQLVDEVGAADIKDSDTAVSTSESKFAEISLHFGVCIVKKAFLGVA
jgi:SAM-dependent methyltransferase